MLKIFKNYLAKSSLVDDLGFYETREKSVDIKRSSKSVPHQTQLFGNADSVVSCSCFLHLPSGAFFLSSQVFSCLLLNIDLFFFFCLSYGVLFVL